MSEFKCSSSCSNIEDCFNVDKWFECNHYQCQRTTIIINQCIECGNNKRIKFFAPRCPNCCGRDNYDYIKFKKCDNCYFNIWDYKITQVNSYFENIKHT